MAIIVMCQQCANQTQQMCYGNVNVAQQKAVSNGSIAETSCPGYIPLDQEMYPGEQQGDVRLNPQKKTIIE